MSIADLLSRAYRLPRLPYWQLLLLQLEGYSLKRTWKSGKLWDVPEISRQSLIWTTKVRLIVGLSILLFLSILLTGPMGWVMGILLLMGMPVFFYGVSTLLLLIPETLVRIWWKKKAKKKLSGLRDRTIIGITGSYGKTSVRHALVTALSPLREVMTPPRNINTPLGLSRWICESELEEGQILVIEMGAHHEGDIKELCELLPPDIAVLNGIAAAHLERFGSVEAIKRAKSEIIEYSKPESTVVINIDDPGCREIAQWKSLRAERTWVRAGVKEESSDIRVQAGVIDTEHHHQSLTLPSGQELILENVLAPYAANTVSMVLGVGQALGIQAKDLAEGLKSWETFPHRMQKRYTPQTDLLVIDDSYNGNPESVRACIQLMQAYKGVRRRVYVTPGLVELGDEADTVHQQLGRDLAQEVELVLLVDTPMTRSLYKGLIESGVSRDDVFFYPTTSTTHAALSQHLKRGDMVVFQNDVTENYG